ncbi:MAG: 4a-hydroxytetrahydrobiopterin dehydratase [Thermoleophilia bacterium]|jgi:4a-hydroxytetrahydrobiopterin dehydratase|nr:4a-hydroxytetrahydrobiopterin dehydratase [Thermoleophilia bacterium]
MAVLSADELAAGLASLPGWAGEGGAIVKVFTFEGGFMGSVGFVNRLAEAAEAADHHPDLAISWNRVTVTLATHSEGGVTAKDLALAAEADRLAGA